MEFGYIRKTSCDSIDLVFNTLAVDNSIFAESAHSVMNNFNIRLCQTLQVTFSRVIRRQLRPKFGTR